MKDLATPVQFGRYRLFAHLATGGMGEVFLATMDGPSGFSRECVIKRLARASDSDEVRDMLMNEARIMGAMHHPNIVQVLDFGVVDDEPYLALEYVDGPTLHFVLRAARKLELPLGPRVAGAVALRLAEALEYAHGLTRADGESLGIVHRDISPGNVLIDSKGRVKLADFGIAKANSNNNETQAGIIKGKFAYMSPEQAVADVLDARSDLFSLGIVLYEIAVGRTLFRSDTPTMMLTAVLNGRIPPPSELVPDFPKDFEAIVMKLLERNRSARYQSGGEVRRDVEKYCRQNAVEGSPETILAETLAQLAARGTNISMPSSVASRSSFAPMTTESPAVVMQSPLTERGVAQFNLSALLAVVGAVIFAGLFWAFVLGR